MLITAGDVSVATNGDIRWTGAGQGYGGGTPIKTFESPASLGSAEGSSTAIRTSDA